MWLRLNSMQYYNSSISTNVPKRRRWNEMRPKRFFLSRAMYYRKYCQQIVQIPWKKVGKKCIKWSWFISSNRYENGNTSRRASITAIRDLCNKYHRFLMTEAGWIMERKLQNLCDKWKVKDFIFKRFTTTILWTTPDQLYLYNCPTNVFLLLIMYPLQKGTEHKLLFPQTLLGLW